MLACCAALRGARSAACCPWSGCGTGTRPALIVRHLRVPRASRERLAAPESDGERRPEVADASAAASSPVSPPSHSGVVHPDERTWAAYRTVSVDGQVFRAAGFGLVRLDGDNSGAANDAGSVAAAAASRASSTHPADEMPLTGGDRVSSSTDGGLPGDFFGIESYAAAVAKRAELRKPQMQHSAEPRPDDARSSESFIEDQYFPRPSPGEAPGESSAAAPREVTTARFADAPAVSFIDEQFFGVETFERPQTAELPADTGSGGPGRGSHTSSAAAGYSRATAPEAIAAVAGGSLSASTPAGVGSPSPLDLAFVAVPSAAPVGDCDAGGVIEAQYFGAASMSGRPLSSTSKNLDVLNSSGIDDRSRGDASDAEKDLDTSINKPLFSHPRRPTVPKGSSRNFYRPGDGASSAASSRAHQLVKEQQSAAPSASLSSGAETECDARPSVDEGSIIARLRRLSTASSEANRFGTRSTSIKNGAVLGDNFGGRPLDSGDGRSSESTCDDNLLPMIRDSRKGLAPLELSPRVTRGSSEKQSPRWQQQQLEHYPAAGSRRATGRQRLSGANSESVLDSSRVAHSVQHEAADDCIDAAPSGGSITDRLRAMALKNSTEAYKKVEGVEVDDRHDRHQGLTANSGRPTTRVSNSSMSASNLPTQQQKRRTDASKVAMLGDDESPIAQDDVRRSWGTTEIRHLPELRRPVDADGRDQDNGQVSSSDSPDAASNAGLPRIKAQIRDWQNETVDTVVYHLKKSVLFQSDELLAVNKPYGLASHGGPEVHHSIAAYLPKLASEMKLASNLHLVHRLDKDTTGVLLLAKTQIAAVTLQRMFQQRQIIKKYWALTRGVPEPTEGIVDIPLAEGSCDGQYRMRLAANSTTHTTAVTRYKVLSQHGSCALVEVEPVTGVKHQIRVHLAFGLDATILGDHKYSHKDKIAPQRLFPDLLHLLGITQAKVRHLPMHLHARSVVVPEFDGGRNVFITAPLPQPFLQNMRRLKVARPPSDDSE